MKYFKLFILINTLVLFNWGCSKNIDCKEIEVIKDSMSQAVLEGFVIANGSDIAASKKSQVQKKIDIVKENCERLEDIPRLVCINPLDNSNGNPIMIVILRVCAKAELRT